MAEKVYDVVIIGGGPGGVAAGVYAARKQMRAVVITDRIGGQSTVSATVENWIGEVSIKGTALAEKLETHLRAQDGLEIAQPVRATALERHDHGIFSVQCDNDTVYNAKNVLIVTGGRHRHLNVPGEEKFKGRGVVYCSTCDAPMFRDKVAAVVGTGNSGLEAVEDLLPWAQKIILISNNDKITGDPVTFDRIMASGKVDVLYNALTTEIVGDVLVSGLRYKDVVSGEEQEIPLHGVFVEIGVVPNTELVKDIVATTDYGHIIVDPHTGATDVPGIYAAGDVTDQPYRQNNIAAGDAIKATLAIYDKLKA